MPDDLNTLQRLRDGCRRLKAELAKVIVGQNEVIDRILVALLCRGHALMIGVPGLAKTLIVKSIAQALDLSFRRIQFTPDLMPSDIVGTDVLEEDPATRVRSFRFIRGPVFANILLADEINRTPPKTQAALLEAMEEHRVTAGGETYTLDEPFFVLATQNPIEQEGTYPLPEAQLDRFFFMISIDYPTRGEERRIVSETTANRSARIETVLNAEDIIAVQDVVRRMPVSDDVIAYAVDVAARTRPMEKDAPDEVKKYVRWGAGPRAGQCMILGAKAKAALREATAASIDDIKAIAHDVLRHRLVLNFHAESDGVSADAIIDACL